MLAKNKTKTAPAPVASEPEETSTNTLEETDETSTEPAWDYALIGKLSHQVHSFEDLYEALSEAEGFKRNRSGVANQVRRMLNIASNPKRPLPNLINPEVKPNGRPRIDWEGIAAQASEGMQAAG